VIHLRPLGFIDTSFMTAKLILSYRDRFEAGDDGIDRILLISDTEPTSLLNEWRSAKALLARLRNEYAQAFGGRALVIDGAWIERVKPDVRTAWTEAETDNLCVMIGMVPCPNAWLYCGGESIVFPVGQIVLVNHRAPHTQANFGPCAQINLVLDVARPGPIE
jgi:hypothetical protein